ncbi:septation ring formation regulator EzrA [Bacillus sp. B1-b2]|uniref:septation ring formation regulator EzrA n=1 Tax=Bacillus sp. B1-b2 TaxID=2653201 RepID=UPI0012615718|nr:septation ring formation regulator EzrA [Bacillus sp. B1-b2]KAB7666763.1 septation ring formation regulator EzrA [Bacillus sp. B1-b2]
MDFLIGGIGILICLFVTGYFIKRKYYQVVDELENWKITIMNRPVLEELGKVKQLNMIGQTEELFERWRKEWDEVVTKELPDIEELLYDTENYIDKYNFIKAKKTQDTIRMKMESVETRLDSILEELNNLVGSEEKNRTEIEALKESYRINKKTLLAHRHTFGETEKKIEEMLQEIAELLENYEEKTNNGDYLEAREIVYSIEEKLSTITYLIEKIPPLLMECRTKLPEQIEELKEGFQSMLAQGYILNHLQMEIEINQLVQELSETELLLAVGEVEQIEKIILESQDKLDTLYDLLEKEVLARNFVSKNITLTKEILENIQNDNSRLHVEVEILQKNYNLTDEDIDFQFKLEKKLNVLYKQFEVLEHKLLTDSTAHTLLSEELKDLKKQLEDASVEQKALFNKLHALRKDEVSAHEKIQQLSAEVADALRKVANSNLPGITEEFNELVKEAKNALAKVYATLDSTPLDMIEVKKQVEDTEQLVRLLIDTTIELLETVYLAERVIQYGNRYRKRYPKLHNGLLEAEAAFRKYQYKEALETAASAIEEVEPESAKKFQSWTKEW